MDIPDSNSIIPLNEKGKAIDLEHAINKERTEDAVKIFNRACGRLLGPSLWHELAGSISASFKLVNEKNDDLHRPAMLNDHIKIDIPGPGPSAGAGYDWVQIEKMEESIDPNADESFGIRLRACKDPGNPEEAIAHFFKEDATSTFIIKRNGNRVTASYHGRNEMPNNEDVKFSDKIRNSIVATGAAAGLSELQWAALIKGFLKDDVVS